MIKNAITQYREHFPGGQLWQRLLSLFCKQHMQHNTFDLAGLKNMEVHEDFPLEKLWKPRARVDTGADKGTLKVLLRSREHPIFRASPNVDGYRVQVIALFPDLVLKTVSHTTAFSPVIPLKSTAGNITFNLPVPHNANAFVICIKLEGMIKETVMLGHSSKGMRIVKTGNLYINSPECNP